VRISFLLPAYPSKPIGGFRVVYEHANELARRGHEVTVVHALRLPGDRRPPPNGTLRRGLRWLGDTRADMANRLSRPLPRWQPVHPRVELRYSPTGKPDDIPQGDVAVATSSHTVGPILACPGNRGRRFHMVQNYPLSEWEVGLLREPLPKIAVSSGLAAAIRRETAQEVHTVLNGISRDFRCVTPLRERPARVGMAVSWGATKGLADGLAALEYAREHVPGVEALLFGTEPGRGLPGWVRYERNLDTAGVVSLYNKCSVFLCSSTLEGFSLPPAEAMACGCAVATTDCGGNSDYAVHGTTALVSPPGEPVALGRNLARLLTDQAFRQALAHAGRRRISDFSWERAGDALERVLTAG
jgi:L-malate glycosyltransferase